MDKTTASASAGQTAPPACDSLIGVRSCGCVTAWMSLEDASKRDIREFYAGMANTDREVRRVNLEDVRGLIGRCEHLLNSEEGA